VLLRLSLLDAALLPGTGRARLPPERGVTCKPEAVPGPDLALLPEQEGAA